MLMASQQGVGQNADGVAAGHWPECLWQSQQGIGQNADGIAAGRWPEC